MAARDRSPNHRSPRQKRGRSSGQSMVELALVLPVLLLITMIALDFGRLYLGWVNLQNMARIAANFAANNPTAWSSPVDATAQRQYLERLLSDARANNCELPRDGSGNQVAPPPTFPSGTSLGGTARVDLTCTFHLITPIVSVVFSQNGDLSVSASAVFPVKSGSGASGGGSACSPFPTVKIGADPASGPEPLEVAFTDESSGSPTSWVWNFGDGTAGSTLQNPTHTYETAGTYAAQLKATNTCGSRTGSFTITVADASLCKVPDFSKTSTSDAQSTWSAAGFTTTVSIKTPPSPPYTINKQTIVGESQVPCGSEIEVSK